MIDKDGYYLWKKGEVYPFNKYFSSAEFSCKCTHKECVDQKVSKILIDKLTELREAIQEPLKISSGFRCSAHQDDVRKSEVSTVVAKNSQHEVGNAADVVPTRTPASQLEQVAARFFDAIGVASTFIHVDLRTDKKNRRWVY